MTAGAVLALAGLGANSSPSGPAGGALTGTYPNPTLATTAIPGVYLFNGVPDGVTDNSALLTAAINSFPTTWDTNPYSYAGVILIPYGQYYFASSVAINRQVHLIGVGSPAGNALGLCQLLFADNIDGLQINHADVPTNGTLGADGTIIEGFYIKRSGSSAGTQGHGINASCRFTLRGCLITNFRGNGINIVANSGGSPSTNANNWHVHDTRIAGNGGHGLYAAGTDANAGCVIGVDSSGNVGYGFYDASFLGNTFVACHAATNTAGGYKTDNANATSVFFGCYQESGQVSSFVAPTICWGGAGMGAGGFTSASTHVALTSDTAGNFANYNGSVGSNQKDSSANTVLTRVGGNPNNGDILNIYHSGNVSNNPRLRWSGTLGHQDIRWDFGDSDSAVTFTLTQQNTLLQFGRGVAIPYALLTNTLFVGSGNSARNITYGSAAPVSGTWGQGDIVFANNATSGGFAGWICTVAGTPGTWKTFGAIS